MHQAHYSTKRRLTLWQRSAISTPPHLVALRWGRWVVVCALAVTMLLIASPCTAQDVGAAPPVLLPPAATGTVPRQPRARSLWNVGGQFSLGANIPFGPHRFGLQGAPGNEGEFDTAFAADVLFGAMSPLPMLGIGLRLSVAVGALNKSRWEDKLGHEMGASLLLNIGPAMLLRVPITARLDLSATVEGHWVVLGTSSREENCGPINCVERDLSNISYQGIATSFSAGLRYKPNATGKRRGRMYWSLDARYSRNRWLSLTERFGGTSLGDLRDDLELLDLDHLSVTLGIGFGF